MKISIKAATQDGSTKLMQLGSMSNALSDKLSDFVDSLEDYNNSEYDYQLPDYLSHEELEQINDVIAILQEFYRSVKTDLKQI